MCVCAAFLFFGFVALVFLLGYKHLLFSALVSFQFRACSGFSSILTFASQNSFTHYSSDCLLTRLHASVCLLILFFHLMTLPALLCMFRFVFSQHPLPAFFTLYEFRMLIMTMSICPRRRHHLPHLSKIRYLASTMTVCELGVLVLTSLSPVDCRPGPTAFLSCLHNHFLQTTSTNPYNYNSARLCIVIV